MIDRRPPVARRGSGRGWLWLRPLVLISGFLAAGCPAKQDSSAAGPAVEAAPAQAEPTTPKVLPMLSKTPLLNARLDITHCAYGLYVNGGLVAQDNEGLPAREPHPINHWLRSGENEIALHLKKRGTDVDRCEAKVAVEYAEHGGDATAAPVTLLELGHSAEASLAGRPTEGSSPPGHYDAASGRPSAQGNLRVGPASVVRLPGRYDYVHVLARKFELSLPFPEWAFFRGERHKPLWEYEKSSEALPQYEALLAEYQRLWLLLQQKDVTGFLNACEERSKEIDLAYYKQPGDTRQTLRQQLESVMNDPLYELPTVVDDDDLFWTLTIGPTGKLLMLTQGERASPILRYQLKDGTPFSIIFPIAFRTEQGRYIVTR